LWVLPDMLKLETAVTQSSPHQNANTLHFEN
jgi:hypothetical protein